MMSVPGPQAHGVGSWAEAVEQEGRDSGCEEAVTKRKEVGVQLGEVDSNSQKFPWDATH